MLQPLRFVWATLGGPAVKRLAPFMAEAVEAVEALERNEEIEIPTVEASPGSMAGFRSEAALRGHLS